MNFYYKSFGYNSTPNLKFIRNNIIKSVNRNLFIITLTPDNHSLVNSSRQDLYIII